MSEPLWFNPICDQLLVKIARWYKNYEKGVVTRTREWMNEHNVVIPKPVRFSHTISFKESELKHLVNILNNLLTKSSLCTDMSNVLANLKKGKLNNNGEYTIILDFYKADVKDMFDTLIKAKSGIDPTEEKIEFKQGESPFQV